MRRIALAAVLLAALALPAAADEWPSRPVRIVNTFAAGGAADILARTVADHLTQTFGQQFFVETRAGAGGAIGVQTVINTPPDGYNFVITTVSLLVLLPISNPKLGFDPRRDLTNIVLIAGSPVVFSVNPASGIKSLPDFVARARESDRPFTYSSSGVGGMGHLVGEFFAQQAGIKIEHVPYKGAAQGLGDLVGGHIVFSAQTVSSTSAYLQAGTLFGVAQAASARMPDYPTIPTFKELGYPEVESTVWFSLSGPAGLPASIVQKVNREVVRAMTGPEAETRLRQGGLIAQPMTVDEFNVYIAAETARWKPVLERVALVGK